MLDVQEPVSPSEDAVRNPTDKRGLKTVPSWEDAYARFRPLLFSALSRLAKHGYITSPTDGLDLIHDFFVEAWHRLASTYDPAKASFETYLYGAFVQFARPRIIKMRRWRESLLRPHDLVKLEVDETRLDEAQPLAHDLLAIRRAISKLNPFEREILIFYASNPQLAEKEIAQRFRLTRYRLRVCLADALGKTAMHLGDAGDIGDEVRAVILSIWRDGRSAKETGRLLQKSTAEIQAMRASLFGMLSGAVKGTRLLPVSRTMSSQSPVDPQAILLSIIRPTASEEDFNLVRSNSEMILQFLDDPSSETFFREHEQELTPECLSRLFDALGVQDDPDSKDLQLLNVFFEAADDDDAEIGNAFSQVLIPNLPTHLTLFQNIFRGAPKIDTDQYQRLVSERSVINGAPRAAELAAYGVTPVTIVEATQAVANLGRRFCDERGIKKSGSFIMDKAGRVKGYSSDAVLARDASVREILLMCELPKPTAERLFDWLSGVASYVPFLFDGFESELKADELCILRTDEHFHDLYIRWSHRPPLAATG